MTSPTPISSVIRTSYSPNLDPVLSLSPPLPPPRPLIQQPQISLPPHRHHTTKNTSTPRPHKRKTQSRHQRPKLPAIHHTRRHSLLDPLPSPLWLRTFQREKTLHGEEVGVEQGRKDDLVDQDAEEEGEVGAVREGDSAPVREEEEPVVGGEGEGAADEEGAEGAVGVVVPFLCFFLRILVLVLLARCRGLFDVLGEEIAQEVYRQRTQDLGYVWPSFLGAIVGTERESERFDAGLDS